MRNKNCLVFGDFNLPSIKWFKEQTFFSNHPKALVFEQFCLEMGFDQIQFFPTRGDVVLDLILVNDALLIATLECGVPMGESDHSSLPVTIVLPPYNCSHSSSNTSHAVFEWVSADWQGYVDFCFGVN